MADQISDSEIVGLFRELQALDTQVRQSEALVGAAYDEWRRVSDVTRALSKRRNELSSALLNGSGPGALGFLVPLATRELPTLRSPFSDKQHDVWTRAYNLAFEIHHVGWVQPLERAKVAASAADEAVRMYGESSTGRIGKSDG